MPEVLAAALFGLLIGSFLNVCIYRWPRDLSVVRPRSRCPGCEESIAWYDNIPVISYLVLVGKCRGCRMPISWRYPIVELLTALLFAWFVYRHGLTWEAAKWCVFSAILITLGFADAEIRILPDEFTLGGIVAGLLFAAVDARFVTILSSVLGAVIPSVALWLGGVLYKRFRGREGLGFGDVKMTAMIGAFVGLQGALLTLVIGSTLGSVLGIAYLAISRKDAASYELPLGSFLAIGGVVFALAGNILMDWYSGL